MRLYSHMLNNGLVFLLRPEVLEGNHGFLNGRGCNSAWKEILESNLLSYESILQLDVSSGFPNLHKSYVSKYLQESGKIPSGLEHHIMTLLSLPVIEGICPTDSAQSSPKLNYHWLLSNPGYLSIMQSYLYNGGKLKFLQNWMKPSGVHSLERLVRDWSPTTFFRQGWISKTNMQHISQNIMLKPAKIPRLRVTNPRGRRVSPGVSRRRLIVEVHLIKIWNNNETTKKIFFAKQ